MANLLSELNQSNKSYCWNTPVATPSNSLIFAPDHEPKNFENVSQVEIIELSKDKTHTEKVNQGIYILVYVYE